MFDASAPLTSLHRDVLSTVCEISFARNSLLYVALNKVDLVEPKSQLFDYSDAISELIWKKKIELLRKVVFSSSANHRHLIQRWINSSGRTKSSS